MTDFELFFGVILPLGIGAFAASAVGLFLWQTRRQRRRRQP